MLERLDRIEALERAGAAPDALLGELRALVAEAEEWVRREPTGTAHAAEAVGALGASLEAHVAAVDR